MAQTDPVADMLTRIRNAQNAKHSNVLTPFSKLRENILKVLKDEGYIKSFKRIPLRKGIEQIDIELKYVNSQPAIKVIERVSKPGKRAYKPVRDLELYYNGLGMSVLSTPKGVMSDHEAYRANVGGEILCKVF
jgi:small subunit ribosomal protein S8